jgi:hypothetical protein
MFSYSRLAIVVAATVAVGVLVSADQGSGAAAKALRNPSALKERAPDTFTANFDTTVGSFVITVHRKWAPNGADRFYNLVKNGFYNDGRFFRAVPNFMVQFGLNGDPTISALWREQRIPPDKVVETNRRGTVTFAMGGSPIRVRRRSSSTSGTTPTSMRWALLRSAKSQPAWKSWTRSSPATATDRREGKGRCSRASRPRAMLT